MSDYQKYKESHLKAQKKYDDKNREKKREYDKKRWQERKAKYQELEQLQQEYKQLKDNWNKIEQIIENERMSHWASSPLFLTELLSKMQELEKGDSNE